MRMVPLSQFKTHDFNPFVTVNFVKIENDYVKNRRARKIFQALDKSLVFCTSSMSKDTSRFSLLLLTPKQEQFQSHVPGNVNCMSHFRCYTQVLEESLMCGPKLPPHCLFHSVFGINQFGGFGEFLHRFYPLKSRYVIDFVEFKKFVKIKEKSYQFYRIVVHLYEFFS